MEKIDLFSTNFQFNFKNKTNYSTGFSLTLSLLFIILSLIIFIWNLELMFTRTNINVNSYRTSVGTDDKIIFNETNSFLAFSFFDEDHETIPENSSVLKYLTIDFSYETSKGLDSNSSKLELIKCNQTINKFLFNSSELNCANFNNTYVQGNFYSANDLRKFYSIRFKFDQIGYLNETNSTNPFLFTIAIFYPISTLNLSQFNNFHNINLGWITYNINFNQQKTYYMSYDLNEIHTDSSFIGKSDNIENIISSKYNFLPSDPFLKDTIFELYLYLNPIKTLYYRKYMNFQDVLNNVNSSVSFIFLVFKLVSMNFNKIKMR